MVFGWLFGKKKATDQQQQQQQGGQQQQKQQQQQQQQAQQNQKQGQSQPEQQQQQAMEDQWVYEFLLQYLTSPLWKVPIYEFLDENCIVFDDEEENKFSYTEIHNKFKKMIEAMIETLMAEIGIDETKLLQYIEIGLKSSHHKKVFEQLLIVDNFLVFKKLMVKRNKELELEALKEMMQNEEEPAEGNEEKLKIASMEVERAEIDHAIQMSMAADEEIRKLQDIEEEELRKVLEMSKVTYQKEEVSRSQVKEKEETPKPDQNQIVDYAITTHVVEQAPVQKKQESPVQKNQESPVKTEKVVSPVKEVQKIKQKEPEPEVEEQKQEFKPLSKLPALKPISALPPLVNKKYEKPIDDLLADRAQLLQQLDSYKAVEDKLRSQQVPEKEDDPNKEESLEERKKRLLAQRELLRKKKQQQREEELKNYKETGDEGKKELSSQQSVLLTDNNTSTEKISAADLQKRQNLMSKIKQNM